MTAANLRSAIHIASLFGIYLSVAMMVPALADFYVSNPDAIVFTRVSVLCTALFAGTAMATREGIPQLNRRMGVLLVNLLWIVFCVLGALPLWLSGEGLTFFKALFESVSAVTTTGSTVMTHLDHAPPGVLLLRSMLQWFGGIGIVALGLFVMPFCALGGCHFSGWNLRTRATRFSRVSRVSFALSWRSMSQSHSYALRLIMCSEWISSMR